MVIILKCAVEIAYSLVCSVWSQAFWEKSLVCVCARASVQKRKVLKIITYLFIYKLLLL